MRRPGAVARAHADGKEHAVKTQRTPWRDFLLLLALSQRERSQPSQMLTAALSHRAVAYVGPTRRPPPRSLRRRDLASPGIKGAVARVGDRPFRPVAETTQHTAI